MFALVSGWFYWLLVNMALKSKSLIRYFLSVIVERVGTIQNCYRRILGHLLCDKYLVQSNKEISIRCYQRFSQEIIDVLLVKVDADDLATVKTAAVANYWAKKTFNTIRWRTKVKYVSNTTYTLQTASKSNSAYEFQHLPFTLTFWRQTLYVWIRIDTKTRWFWEVQTFVRALWSENTSRLNIEYVIHMWDVFVGSGIFKVSVCEGMQIC